MSEEMWSDRMLKWQEIECKKNDLEKIWWVVTEIFTEHLTSVKGGGKKENEREKETATTIFDVVMVGGG